MTEQPPGQHPDEPNNNNPESPTPEERLARMKREADFFSPNGLDTAFALGMQGYDRLPENFIAYYHGYTNEMAAALTLGQEARAATGEQSRTEESTPEKSFALLKAEHPDISPHVLNYVFDDGKTSDPMYLKDRFKIKDMFDESRLFFSPEQQRILIDAYNLGAEMGGHPPYIPSAAGETAHEPTIAIIEPAQAASEIPRQNAEASPSAAQPDAEGATLSEPATLLQPESDEPANTELAELQRNLDATRTKYAEASFILEKGGEARDELRDREEEMMKKIFPSRLAHIRIATGEQQARQEYLAAVREIRKLRGEQIRDEMNRKYNPDANASSRTTFTKEMGDRMKAAMEEIAIREHIALYNEKTRLMLTPERGPSFDRAWKCVQRSAEWYNNLDARHRDPTKGRFHWKNLPRNKILISAGLFGASLGAGFVGLTAAGVIVGGFKTTQRILGGAAVSVATDAYIHHLFERSYEKKASTFKGLENVPTELADLANNLDEVLTAINWDLDDHLLESVERRIARKSTDRAISRTAGLFAGSLVGGGYAARGVRSGLSYASELTGITPAWVAEKLGIMPKPGVAEVTTTQQAGAAPAGVTPAPKEPRFFSKMGSLENWKKVARGSLGDETPEPQKPTANPTIEQTQNAAEPEPQSIPKKEIFTPPAVETPPQTPPPLDTTEPGAKVETPAPVETPPPAPPAASEPAPKATASAETPDAPRTAAEVAARARAIESATVRKGEGAWQAVRRQMYARLYDDTQKNPIKYGITPEQAAKLPHDFEHPPKTGKIAKFLDRETLTTLKTAGYINADGTTHVGMRPGAHVLLTPDNKIDIGGDGKSIYEFDKSKAGSAYPADEVRRARGNIAKKPGDYTSIWGEQRGANVTGGSLDNTDGITMPVAAEAAEYVTNEEYAASPAGQVAAEAAAVKTETANLRASHLTPAEYRPLARMRMDHFLTSIERNATQIREYSGAGSRTNASIRITEGNFTTRGFNASIKEAGKYLDLSERLKEHLKTLRLSEQTRLLKQPIKEVLRTLSLKK